MGFEHKWRIANKEEKVYISIKNMIIMRSPPQSGGNVPEVQKWWLDVTFDVRKGKDDKTIHAGGRIIIPYDVNSKTNAISYAYKFMKKNHDLLVGAKDA